MNQACLTIGEVQQMYSGQICTAQAGLGPQPHERVNLEVWTAITD